MSNSSHPIGRPVIYGEVLFDRFPGGEAVLGGAPFNVAWHLKGFGLDPLFISRIGHDPLGEQVVETMHAWHMDVRGLQRDPAHPTGTVQIDLQDGQPTFHILPEQAYDSISADPLQLLLQGESLSLLYAGSLITRGPVSRASLDHLQRQYHLPLFVDINLRDPWWDLARVEGSLTRARWAKLNDQELSALLGRPLEPDQLAGQAELVRTRFDLELVVLTRGAQGADLIRAGGHIQGRPEPVENLVDAVGAGDAFSAVTILGLLLGWDGRLLLDRALEFAARICLQRGATAPDPALYEHYKDEWRL